MRIHQLQKGQTLVETMVAIFILVMGITAALGLAIYSFNATSLVNKQVIAMGLAREGVEAVKNMRDTNWLKSRNFDSTCNCYKDWLGSYYALTPFDKEGYYTLDFNPFAEPYWTLDGTASSFRLFYDPIAENGRFYYPSISKDPPKGVVPSDYFRGVSIIAYTKEPFSADNPRLEVTSDVWWVDKKCPEAATYDQSKTSCRIRLQTYLTNWKNY